MWAPAFFSYGGKGSDDFFSFLWKGRGGGGSNDFFSFFYGRGVFFPTEERVWMIFFLFFTEGAWRAGARTFFLRKGHDGGAIR